MGLYVVEPPLRYPAALLRGSSFKRREAPHFLSVLSSVFGKKSGGIFIKPNLKAAENKGWRIRETINIIKEEIFYGVQGTYGFFMYRNRI